MFRSLALDLANLLAKKGILDPGFGLPNSPSTLVHLYLDLAQQYSKAAAEKNVNLTAPFLQEIVLFTGPLSNSGSQGEYKQLMLRVIYQIFMKFDCCFSYSFHGFKILHIFSQRWVMLQQVKKFWLRCSS
jgi:hypothetical protein